MRRVFLYLIFLLISINLVLAVTVTRDMPGNTDSDRNITVTLNIKNAEVGSLFSLIETVPLGFSIVDWVVSGSTETADILTIKNNIYNWSFTPTKADPQISYSVSVPKTANGQYSFYASWSSENETGSDQISINVISILCGNGICDTGENENNCASDCKKTEVKTEDAWPFSEKKKKEKSSFVIVLAVLTVLGLTGLGIYRMIQMKKGKKFDIKIPKIKKTLKSIKKDIKQPEPTDRDYVEKFGSELPSFKDESTVLELPSLEEHKKELHKATEQKQSQPPPVKTPKEEPKKEEIHEDYKKKVDDIDELFDNVFEKEKGKSEK